MGACGSSTNQKPTTSNIKPQQQIAIPNPTESNSKQAPKRNAESESSNKKIKIRFISEEEDDLKNFVLEKEYDDSTTFSQVVKDLQNKENTLDQEADYNYSLLIIMQYILSDNKKIAGTEKIDLTTSVKMNHSLKTILENKKISNSLAVVEFSYSGLKIPKDVKKAYINLNNYISSPKYENEPFGINIYDNSSSNLHYYSIPDEISEKFQINIKNFNNFSAYCNGKNKLFISGGIIDDNFFIGDFIEIDLEKLSHSGVRTSEYIRKLPNLNVPRGWHSMLFVPDKYIFIVGGSNTNSVELYDLDTNKLTVDSDLNERRSETSLCLVNNYFLYAFCGFQFLSNFSNVIEKCNLRKSQRTWEKIVLANSDVSIISNFYTIAYGKSYRDNYEIILVGANENYSNKQSDSSKHKKNYLFKQIGKDDHILEEFNMEETGEPCVCSEKFFLPVNDTHSILMPTYIAENLSVLRFNPNIPKLDEIKFEPLNNNEEGYNFERNESKFKIGNQ